MQRKILIPAGALALSIAGWSLLHFGAAEAQRAPPFICNGVRQASPNCAPPTPQLRNFARIDRSFGALAYDDGKAIWYGSYRHPTKRSAQEGVMENCAGNGGTACRLMLSYTNQCAAVARAVSDGREQIAHDSVDTGSTEEEAVDHARQSCQGDWGTNTCSIKLVNCSHHDIVKWSAWVYE